MDKEKSCGDHDSQQVKTMQFDDTVLIVGPHFDPDGKETLKDILERSIKKHTLKELNL